MAIEQNLRVIQNTPPGSSNLWQIYRRLGGLYQRAGDSAQARTYGQNALAVAPAGYQAEISSWLKTVP
jgi:hypothetical protein